MTTLRRGITLVTRRSNSTLAKQQPEIIEPSVLVKKNLAARSLVLNRPRRLNALDMEMVDIMYPYLKTWEESSQANVIFLEGVGRALCAGGDVKDVVNMVKDPSQHAKLNFQIDTEYEMMHFLGTMKTPYIAIMNGITMGAGSGLACPAPFRIATENTQFAYPETAIGLFCDVGASFYYSRLDGYLGRYMGLTSRVVKAEDALFSGVATHFVHSSQLEALKNHLAELDKPDHDQVHEIIEEYAVKSDHQPQEYTLHGEERQIIDHCFKHNTAEEILKALRENGSKFAKDTADTILKRSPSSIKITLEHLRRGSKMSFKDCLRMEHQLWQTVPYAHDFVEGVTSHVVNKIQPKWNPSNLEDLDLERDIIVRYFNANTLRRARFRNEQDYHLHPFRRYGLPSEKEIFETIASERLHTATEAVDWFVKNRKDKFGVRQKVIDVFNRLK